MRESTVAGIGVAVVSMLVLLSAVHCTGHLVGSGATVLCCPNAMVSPCADRAPRLRSWSPSPCWALPSCLRCGLVCSAISSAGRPCTGLAGWSPPLFSCEASGTSGGWASFAGNAEIVIEDERFRRDFGGLIAGRDRLLEFWRTRWE
jgi:hypothetical protein